MAWSWGVVTLDFEEEPVGGEIESVRNRVWAFANPRGSNKTLKQKMHNESLRGKVNLRLSEATKNDLQAIFEADEAIEHINPRPPWDAGINVIITKFSAAWNPSVPGTDSTIYEWDCVLEFMED